MMRRSAAFFVLFVISFPVFSQRYYTSDPSGSIIFMAGLNSSNLITDTAKHASVKTPLGGLMYSFIASEKFNVNLGANYIAKGYKNEKLHQKHRYFYVDIPLYVQYKPGPDLRIDLGAQYSIFTNATTTLLDGDKKGGQNTIRHNEPLKSHDPALLAGIDLKITDDFDLAARYTRSFSTFKKEAGFSSFQLHIHYHMLKFYGRGKKKEEAPQQ